MSASIVVVPLLAAFCVATLAHRAVSVPGSLAMQVLWWGAQIGLGALAYAGVEDLMRHLLPLAALLKMSLVFPDRAPSRVAVARRAASTKDLAQRAEQAADQTTADAAREILSLAASLSTHDRTTRGHSERVRVFADMIASELKLDQATTDRLRWAALLHDVGKLTVHPRVLNKDGKPDEREWEILRRHPLEGAKIVAPLGPWLGEWALAIEQHHEKFDGAGYPYGLAGEQISYGARIVAVADVYDTLTAKRSYKDAITPTKARAELARCAGAHFDPAIVRAFLNISIGRLRWAVGPASLLAQLPFVGQLPFLFGQSSGALAGITSGAAGAVALSVASALPTATPSATLPVRSRAPVASTTPVTSRASSYMRSELGVSSTTTTLLPPPVGAQGPGGNPSGGGNPNPGGNPSGGGNPNPGGNPSGGGNTNPGGKSNGGGNPNPGDNAGKKPGDSTTTTSPTTHGH